MKLVSKNIYASMWFPFIGFSFIVSFQWGYSHMKIFLLKVEKCVFGRKQVNLADLVTIVVSLFFLRGLLRNKENHSKSGILSFFSRWCEKTPLSRDVYTLDRNKQFWQWKQFAGFANKNVWERCFRVNVFSKWRNFHFKRLCFDCSICWFCFLGILYCKK